jgi:hypothetical protein
MSGGGWESQPGAHAGILGLGGFGLLYGPTG